jgi:predicted helicase
VICYVTNGGYIDSNTADGLRKTLADEFHAIYCLKLRGNTRTSGEQARREGGQTFGSGSRATVAILLLVKKPEPSTGATILYRDIGDYLTRQEKLDIVAHSALDNIEWQQVIPNAEGDWINQRNTSFEAFAPIGAKRSGEIVVFRAYSGGLKTNRDAWVYNYSRHALRSNVKRMIDFYNTQVDDYAKLCHRRSIVNPTMHVDDFIDRDPIKIGWDRADKARLARGIRYNVRDQAITTSTYRPFCRQHIYFDRQLNNTVYQLPQIFPTPEHCNFGIYLTGTGAMKPFAVLAVDQIPDLNFWGSEGGQFFPRYTYEHTSGAADLFSDDTDDEYTRIDNITDAVLADYRSTYGLAVSKDDIFYYVYALLHSPDYRTKFAADLKKMLPRIPKVTTAQDFNAYVKVGRELVTLHIGYENVEPYPLHEVTKSRVGTVGGNFYRVHKMTFGKNDRIPDKSTIIYNSNVTLAGIPTEAYEYMLGSRSAIEWIMERYQVKTDKASGIVNDPNDWATEIGEPRYIIDLLRRIITVSLETIGLLKGLPTLRLIG